MNEVNNTDDAQSLLNTLSTEPIIKKIPTVVFVCVINILGIIGNILTILFYRTKKLTNSSLLITVLAIIDLSTCFLLFGQVILVKFAFTFTSVITCKISAFLSFSFLTSSILILILISIERHRKLCRPFGWQFSIRSCKLTIACLIALAIVISGKHIPYLAPAKLNLTAIYGTQINGYNCEQIMMLNQTNIVMQLHILDMVLVVVSIALFVILYLHIGRTILKSRKKLKMSFAISQGQPQPKSSTCIPDRVVETSNNKVTTQGDTQMKDVISSKSLHIHAASLDTGGTTDYEINCETNNLQNKVETQDQGRRITDTELNGNPKDIQNKAKEKAYVHKIEQTMTLISGLIALGYIISFIPYFIVILYVKFSGIEYNELGIGMQIAASSYVLNSAINPFIIGYFNVEFRKYIKDLLCKERHCLK